MSKKKKFAGKTTKLAEHALTQVLAQEKSEDSAPLQVPPLSLTLAQVVQALRNDQLPLDLPPADSHPIPSPRQLETVDAYLGVLKELEEMRELLRAPDLPVRPRVAGQKPWTLPNAEIVEYSLQVIDKTLRDLKTILD
jgi:hypothetical protein